MENPSSTMRLIVEILKKPIVNTEKKKISLMPGDIKQIRQQYGITQVGFSRVLGFGDKTIARYENGALQDTAPNNLILLMKNEKNFIELWEKRKNLLDPKDVQNVERTLSSKYPTVKIDWNAVFNYNSLNTLYKSQRSQFGMSDLKFLGYRVPKIDFSIGDQFGSGPVQWTLI